MAPDDGGSREPPRLGVRERSGESPDPRDDARGGPGVASRARTPGPPPDRLVLAAAARGWYETGQAIESLLTARRATLSLPSSRTMRSTMSPEKCSIGGSPAVVLVTIAYDTAS